MKAKSGIQRILFSRTGFILILMFLQFLVSVVTTRILFEYTVYVHGALTILGVIVLIYIINSEDNPAFKMTWMLAVMAFPAVGTIAYIYNKTHFAKIIATIVLILKLSVMKITDKISHTNLIINCSITSWTSSKQIIFTQIFGICINNK